MTTILYVEDNEDNIYMPRKRLDRRGYRVLIDRDGEQGVITAKESLPDIILMDLELPAIDGWKAIHLLRGETKTRHIPIIAVSAYSMDYDRESALKAGANDFISKPVKFPQLLNKLEKLISS